MRQALFAVTAVGLSVAAPSASLAASAAALDAAVDAALPRLLAAAPEAQQLYDKASAVLIFPDVVKAGAIVGGQYGEGVLRKGGETAGYYATTAASFGLQLGAQRFGYALFFMDDASLAYLDGSAGWDVGSAPTVVYGDEGWSGSIAASQLQGIVTVFFGQEGVMAGLGLQGAKITELSPD